MNLFARFDTGTLLGADKCQRLINDERPTANCRSGRKIITSRWNLIPAGWLPTFRMGAAACTAGMVASGVVKCLYLHRPESSSAYPLTPRVHCVLRRQPLHTDLHRLAHLLCDCHVQPVRVDFAVVPHSHTHGFAHTPISPHPPLNLV